MKTGLKVIKTIILWASSLFLWFLYTYYTLDRSEATIAYIGNPIPSGFSFIVLPIVIAILLRKQVFTNNIRGWSLVSKIIVLLLLLIGIAFHWPINTGQ
ncbi:MAG TPA: hypothetical protein VLH94_00355 [Spirochaetia bacterium]|nr:hypothetical protein [Spirochaetia bacterium]